MRSKSIRVDFNKPTMVGREFEYITQAFDISHVSGDGPFTERSSRLLEEVLGVKRVLLTTSCTHALEMSALLLDIKAGDEVIVPSFTFVSTVNAFVLRGAKPVFIDSRPDTLNMDESRLKRLISRHTKAIVPVHYAGVGCEMDAILSVADEYGIPVIEDNAHGLFGKYKSKYLGTFGCMAAQSFHETKNITCGEGGALLVNDPRYIEQAEIVREKGTNRSRFFRGQVDKYTWVNIGSSYLMSDILAAFLYAQLKARKLIQKERKNVWKYYHKRLADWATRHNVSVPVVPEHCEQAFHMFYLIMPSLDERQAFIAHLKSKGIISVFHYLPLHLSAMGRKLGGRKGDCPVAEDVSDRLVRLPFYNNLSRIDQQRVVDAILCFN
jgi:dTDP-4-amino-4,6-dideoxygalactose transaminase